MRLSKRTTAILVALAMTMSLQSSILAGETESPEQTVERINQILAKGSKPSEKDSELLGEIVANQPNNGKAHLTLGLAYEALGLPEQSLEQYKIAMQLEPDDPQPLADVLRQRINTKQLSDTTQLIGLAMRKFPNNAEVLFYAGYIQLENRDMSDATALLQKAYNLDPKIPLLKVSLAECKLNRHIFAQAFVLAKEELRQNPNVPKADMIAGLALVHLQRYDQAVDLLGKACAAMPDNWDLAEKLARVAVWSGRYKDAIGPICLFLVQRSDERAPEKSMNALLLDCLRHTNRQEAEEIINEVCQKQAPAAHNAYFHNQVGEVLAKVGWDDAATAQFKEAVKLAPTSALINFNLGKECEFYLHDYAKALEYYKKAEVGTDIVQTPATDYANRLEDRLSRSRSDVAWRLKDLLTTPHQQ